MNRVIKIRPHHFNILLLIWYPREHWGGNPLNWMCKEEEYTAEHVEFWRKLSENIRNGDELLIEPTPTLDSICENCKQTTQRYKPYCEKPDSGYRHSDRLFLDMDLRYGTLYPAKEIVEKMNRWAKEHPHLPIME